MAGSAEARSTSSSLARRVEIGRNAPTLLILGTRAEARSRSERPQPSLIELDLSRSTSRGTSSGICPHGVTGCPRVLVTALSYGLFSSNLTDARALRQHAWYLWPVLLPIGPPGG